MREVHDAIPVAWDLSYAQNGPDATRR
jgi:hypothetical protein